MIEAVIQVTLFPDRENRLRGPGWEATVNTEILVTRIDNKQE